MNEFVSVIVPTHKRPELFLNCIKSLSEQNYTKEDYEIIAVHDGLEDGYDGDGIRKCLGKVKNFKFERVSEGGVARARNYAIQIARGSLILMIDDDCQAKNDWIGAFVKYMAGHKDIVGAGGTILSVPPETFVQKYIDFKNLLRKPVRDASGNIIALITANVCFRKSVLDKVGGFKEVFRHYGGEDLDLSFRCGKYGKLAYCEDAIVYHNHRKQLRDLVRQHIFYGRGTFLAYKLNNIDIDFKVLKFYEPTLPNLFKYLWYVLKRIFTVSLPEFREKKLELSLYVPYAFLDIIRKLSFMAGVTLEHHKKIT